MSRKNGNTVDLEMGPLSNHLWEAANILRGPVDAADFKTYIFPLLFFKRISDVYDEEYAVALKESDGDMNKPKERKKKVLFINAVNEVTRERAQSFLTPEHIQRIVSAYTAYADENGFARVVGNDEIVEKGANLSMDSGNIHIRRWGEFGDDYVGPAFHRIFRKGQILYGSRRTYLKKVATAEFDGITANTTFVCETKDKNVFMQELLPFLMLTDSFTEHSVRESKGSTNPYINWPDIAKYQFPLPPLAEQKRIAELLWAADEVLEKFKASVALIATVQNQALRESLQHGAT